MPPWTDLLLAAICSVGHAALMVALINRLDGLKIGRGLLSLLSAAHHVGLVVYPALLGGMLFGGPSGVFVGLPDWLRWYSWACAIIALIVPVRVAQNLLRRRPRALISETSQAVDLSEGQARQGPMPWLPALPGNESLTICLTEKHLCLPRLPPEWEGLRILHVSDTHFTGTIPRSWFEQVFSLASEQHPDLVAFTGDLLDRPELAEWIPHTFGRLQAPLGCWFVLGNHDWYAADPEELRRELERIGWRDASAGPHAVDHLGHRLVVAGTERPWMGLQPDLADVPPRAMRLLLSHSPDQFPWAVDNAVDLMLAGHTHGGQVRLPLLGPIYCPSRFGPKYSAGVFWKSPTALHVTRGLSGQTPLRLNCPPEAAVLVLHAEPRA